MENRAATKLYATLKEEHVDRGLLSPIANNTFATV